MGDREGNKMVFGGEFRQVMNNLGDVMEERHRILHRTPRKRRRIRRLRRTHQIRDERISRRPDWGTLILLTLVCAAPYDPPVLEDAWCCAGTMESVSFAEPNSRLVVIIITGGKSSAFSFYQNQVQWISHGRVE